MARTLGALEHAAHEDLVRLELEGHAQLLERAVARAVVDHDHLVLRVLEGEQRLDRGHDHGLFVVRGGDDADRNGEARARECLVVLAPALLTPHRALERADHDERDVHEGRQQEIREADEYDDAEDVARHAARSVPREMWRAARDSAASRSRSPPAS